MENKNYNPKHISLPERLLIIFGLSSAGYQPVLSKKASFVGTGHEPLPDEAPYVKARCQKSTRNPNRDILENAPEYTGTGHEALPSDSLYVKLRCGKLEDPPRLTQ